MQHRASQFAVIVVVLLALQVVRGARVSPPPRLIQMEDGYAIVRATIKDTAQNEQIKTASDVTFAIDEVVTQPVAGDLPLKKRDKITLLLSAGYGGDLEVEDGARPVAFTAGNTYLLSIRQNPKSGGYEHSHGASSLEPAADLADARRNVLKKLRDLAAMKPGDRRAACLEVVADPKMALELRQEALQEFGWLNRSNILIRLRILRSPLRSKNIHRSRQCSLG